MLGFVAILTMSFYSYTAYADVNQVFFDLDTETYKRKKHKPKTNRKRRFIKSGNRASRSQR